MPTLVLFLSLLLVSEQLPSQEPIPRSVDPNIKISLFASEPTIVTPTGIAVDRNGRVFCIESHTHFRPQDYKGPKTDRIRIYDDTSGDGSSDRITTFYEGSTATMNMAFAPDGSLYVATRSSIFCLRDRNSDDKADQNKPIVKLETKGNYPHNGLSGLAFDENGLLYFGFGENLGVDYSLVGNDGTTLSGGGEGGNIYSCDLDGNRLRRVATGFWNPFGLAFDRSGSLFAIDNDPDWRPPCRLLHIVNGGDYGYRFSLGRRGTHPFTAWFGELPGTLGLVSGTGEAPSGILRQRSVSAEGKDVFLTTSWGLHSIEKFVLHEKGASFASRPETWIKGGNDFRPVGLASAPDGTIYISDWCKRSYQLHGFGRIWKVEFKKKTVDSQLILNDFPAYPYSETDIKTRQAAANRVPSRKIDFPKAIQAALSPLEKATLLRRSQKSLDRRLLISYFADNDPFIRQAARYAFANSVAAEELASMSLPAHPKIRLGLALVMRDFSKSKSVSARLGELLSDTDPQVRFVAIRWIGEERKTEYQQQLEKDLRSRPLTGRLFESYLAALDLISKNRQGADFEKAEAEILAKILGDATAPVETKVVALRKLQSAHYRDQFNSQHPKLNIDLLTELLSSDQQAIVQEVVETIRDLDSQQSARLLHRIVKERDKYGRTALSALIGLNSSHPEDRKLLLDLALEKSLFASSAIQTLIGTKFQPVEKKQLASAAVQHDALTRLLQEADPHPRDTSAVVNLVKNKLESANSDRGRLIFFNKRFGQCSRCHQVDGRGGMIGPDLSNLADMSVERLLESILEPSKEISPRHTSWLIETYDGRSLTGVLVAERGEVQTYADTNGQTTKVKFDDIERIASSNQSIMPEKLTAAMTISELADLVRFLKN